jgi:hypothetical protein
MTTKIPVELSSTPGIVDGSNATAITIDSSENVTFSGTILYTTSYAGDGSASSPSIRFNNAATGLYHAGSDELGVVVSGGEKVRVKANGNVGIGTTSPTRTVDINHASTAPDLRLGCDGNDAPMIILDADVSSAGDTISHLVWRWNNTDVALITGFAGSDTTNKDDGGLSFSTRTSGSATAERMRIDSSGNVGIGETAPLAKLHIKRGDSGLSSLNAAGDHIFLENTGSNGTGLTLASGNTSNGSIIFGDQDSNYRGVLIYDHSADAMKFVTAGAEAMRINDAGLVCIGDTTERSGNQDTIKALQVTGGEAVMGIKNETVTDASHRGMIIFTINDNSAQGRITCNNSATLFTSLSDYRLKEVLEPLPNGLDRLNQLNPVKFKWKKQGYNAEGFLAHEVAEIYPEAVSGEKDGKDMQSMDYGRITPLLVKAIQELTTKLEAAEARITTLEG